MSHSDDNASGPSRVIERFLPGRAGSPLGAATCLHMNPPIVPPGPPSPPSGSSPSDSSSESDATTRKRSTVPTKRKELLEKADRIKVIRPANSRFKTLLDCTTHFLIRRQLMYTPKEGQRSHRLNKRLD